MKKLLAILLVAAIGCSKEPLENQLPPPKLICYVCTVDKLVSTSPVELCSWLNTNDVINKYKSLHRGQGITVHDSDFVANCKKK